LIITSIDTLRNGTLRVTLIVELAESAESTLMRLTNYWTGCVVLLRFSCW